MNGADAMPKRKAQAKSTQTLGVRSDDEDGATSDRSPPMRRHNPPWHRQYLRRLAIHGNKSRAAKEVNIDYRHVLRVERAKPRFRKATIAALRIADQRYAERLEAKVHELAIDGYQQPMYQHGKHVGYVPKYLPALTRHVLDTVAPRYRKRADAKIGARMARDAGINVGNGANGGNYSVSQTTNVLNISLASAPNIADPVIRQALLTISNRLTAPQAEPSVQAIDVTPANPGDEA